MDNKLKVIITFYCECENIGDDIKPIPDCLGFEQKEGQFVYVKERCVHSRQTLVDGVFECACDKLHRQWFSKMIKPEQLYGFVRK